MVLIVGVVFIVAIVVLVDVVASDGGIAAVDESCVWAVLAWVELLALVGVVVGMVVVESVLVPIIIFINMLTALVRCHFGPNIIR